MAVKAVTIGDNLPVIALSTSRLPSSNPYHLNGSDQAARLQSLIAENERQRVTLDRQLLSAEKKQDEESPNRQP